MNKQTANDILDTIKEYYVNNPKPELDFNNNFELVCAVLLSAQTTDKRVNLVTKELFLKYPTPKEMMEADILDVKNIILSVGLANNKAKNLIDLSKKLYNDYNSIVPNTLEELMKVNGHLNEANMILKMDVEGAEMKALEGAKKHILSHRPKLGISVYHKPTDLLDVWNYLRSLVPDYHFYLRNHTPLWDDIILYAV